MALAVGFIVGTIVFFAEHVMPNRPILKKKEGIHVKEQDEREVKEASRKERERERGERTTTKKKTG